MEAKLIKIIPGYKPLHVREDGFLVAARRLSVYLMDRDGKVSCCLGRLKPDWRHGLKTVHRLVQRAFRAGFHSLIPLQDKVMIGSIGGAIVRLDLEKKIVEPTFRITKGSRPLNLCKTDRGNIYFGEYFRNVQRAEVHIWGSTDSGLNWQPVYTFPKGEIRHVHGLFYDPYRKGYWILTGDTDRESRLAFSDDEFRTINTVWSGSQSVRAVSIIVLPEGLIVPTDTELEQNHVQFFDPDTLRISKIQPMPGSIMYTYKVGHHLLLSTCVEPSHCNHSRYSHLFLSSDRGARWTSIFKAEKDGWPARYFQYGVFQLPTGGSSDARFHAYARSLKELDDSLLIFELQTADDL